MLKQWMASVLILLVSEIDMEVLLCLQSFNSYDHKTLSFEFKVFCDKWMFSCELWVLQHPSEEEGEPSPHMEIVSILIENRLWATAPQGSGLPMIYLWDHYLPPPWTCQTVSCGSTQHSGAAGHHGQIYTSCRLSWWPWKESKNSNEYIQKQAWIVFAYIVVSRFKLISVTIS